MIMYGREACITCNQGIKDLPNCTKSRKCNPDVEKKGGLPSQESIIPSLYVGETNRFEQERGIEHVKAARKKEESSHMRRHQLLVHDGLDNDFILKVVSYHGSALSRQIKEAV